MGLFNKKKIESSDINDSTKKVKNEVIKEINPEEKSNPATSGYYYREAEIFGFSLKDWKEAVETAISEYNANRIDLADIYKSMLTYDSQIISTIQQRKLSAMQQSIVLYNNDGTINEEQTMILNLPTGANKTWITNFVSYTLDAIFWGFELLMIDYKDGELIVTKIPERNIIPHDHIILKDTRYTKSETNKIDYTDKKYANNFCSISYTGDLRDLGLLSACAPYFYSKCTGNWKMHADKFGMLTRVLKTDSSDKVKMMGGYKALEQQTRANFIIIDKEEELLFEGDGRTDIAMYKNLNEYCDSCISKIILSQTGTTDEKSFVGSANVHMGIFEKIINTDKYFVEHILNTELKPKLVKLGIIKEDVYFGFEKQNDVNIKEELENLILLKNLGFEVDANYIKTKYNIDVIKSENNTQQNG